MSESVPTASVVTITYNHAPYIRQCIEGVLMQETDFPIEYIIAEDCSTDGTREIVSDYARRYPDRIRLMVSDRNIGAVMNAKRAFDACRGRYTAVCEGDDYWTDPSKMQAQVGFLEAHPEFSMCFHPVEVREQSGLHAVFRSNRDQKEVSDIYDLFAVNFICTVSCMYRNYPDLQYPQWFRDMVFTDWPFHILHADRGKIGFINKTMAVYRLNPGGVWTSKNEWDRVKSGIPVFTLVDEHLQYKYHDRLGALVAELYQVLADHERKFGNKIQSLAFHHEARKLLVNINLVAWIKCVVKFQLSKFIPIRYDYRI